MPETKKSSLEKLINIGTAEDLGRGNPFLNIKNREDETWADWHNEYDGQLAVDVFQDKNDIIIKSTIAGAKPDDIEVSVNNDMVTIRGKREMEEEVEEKDYYYKECYWGGFSRSIILPAAIDADNVSAELKDGILTIILPRINTKNTKIAIRHIEDDEE